MNGDAEEREKKCRARVLLLWWPNGIRTRVWSRSRFRHAFLAPPRRLTWKNAAGFKHAMRTFASKWTRRHGTARQTGARYPLAGESLSGVMRRHQHLSRLLFTLTSSSIFPDGVPSQVCGTDRDYTSEIPPRAPSGS